MQLVGSFRFGSEWNLNNAQVDLYQQKLHCELIMPFMYGKMSLINAI